MGEGGEDFGGEGGVRTEHYKPVVPAQAGIPFP